MFEQIAKNNGRRPWTIAASFLFQSVLVAVMVLIPMIYTDAVPGAQTVSCRFPIPLSPLPAPGPRPQGSGTIRPNAAGARFLPSTRTPTIIDMTTQGPSLLESPPSIAGDSLSFLPGVSGGPGNWISGMGGSPYGVPPPLPPVKHETTTSTVRRGGDVQQALLISQPKPQYPSLAKQARISGVVRLAAIISEAGAIEQLRVLSGHPLLVQAALDAVRQWRYRPTLLNGAPVKVETTIDVNFSLSQ